MRGVFYFTRLRITLKSLQLAMSSPSSGTRVRFLMKHFFVLLFTLFLPLTAFASTMTFNKGAGVYEDTNDDGFANRYTENGITVTGLTIDGLTYGEKRGHLDNFGGPFANRLIFTYLGRFNFVSFELWAIGSGICGQNLVPCDYDHVELIGYRDATTITHQLFPMDNVPSLRLGGKAFSSLASLQIYGPPPPYYDDLTDIHFEIDDLILAQRASVPLPASPPMMAIGIGALVLTRRPRRHA